jgi:excinuclease ABC subunit C
MIYIIEPGFHLGLPERTGVYLYRDKDDNLIYIGKAKNLKKRIATYFYDTKQHTEKTKRMVRAAKTVELRFASSELEALLMEARLIRSHLPLYNRALRNYKAYPFIVLRTDQPFPYVEVSRDSIIPDAMYFGPYLKASWLHHAVDALNNWLKLRRCSGPLPSGSCLYADMKQCLAPCVDSSIDAAYETNVTRAITVLEGGQAAVKEELEMQRDDCAASLRFEEAMQWQRLISLAQYNSKIKRSVNSHHTLVVSQAGDLHYTGLVIIHGRMIETLKVQSGKEEAVSAMLQEARRIYRGTKGKLFSPGVEEIDEMLIIASWLEHHADELETYPLNEESVVIR